MSTPKKTLRETHADATRHAVLHSARILLARNGFAATSIDEIADHARVTKGAVYHHFESKRDVFREVYTELAIEVDARVRETVAETANPLEKVQLAVDAFLACAQDPAIRRVMFLDGMAVLAGECREIDARHFLELLGSMLIDLRNAELLIEVDVEMMARLILAALIEAAQMLGRARNLEATQRVLRVSLTALFAGLIALPS